MFKGKDYDINDYCLDICDEYGGGEGDECNYICYWKLFMII
jgi:hypothetical protein